MRLDKLLERLDYKVLQGTDQTEITTLINDSRKAEKGSQTDTAMPRMWRLRGPRLLWWSTMWTFRKM